MASEDVYMTRQQYLDKIREITKTLTERLEALGHEVDHRGTGGIAMIDGQYPSLEIRAWGEPDWFLTRRWQRDMEQSDLSDEERKLARPHCKAIAISVGGDGTRKSAKRTRKDGSWPVDDIVETLSSYVKGQTAQWERRSAEENARERGRKVLAEAFGRESSQYSMWLRFGGDTCTLKDVYHGEIEFSGRVKPAALGLTGLSEIVESVNVEFKLDGAAVTVEQIRAIVEQFGGFDKDEDSDVA